MANPLDSKITTLGGTTYAPGNACTVDDTLLFAYSGDKSVVTIAVNDVSAFLQSHTPSDLENWKSTDLMSVLKPGSSSMVSTALAPAGVAFGGHYFLFWIDVNGNLRGVRSAPDLSGASMIHFSGKPANSDQPAVISNFTFGQVPISACVTPDGRSIAIQFLAEATQDFESIAQGAAVAITFLFDPATYHAAQNWTGVYYVRSFSQIAFLWSQGYTKGSFAWMLQADASGNPAHFQVMTAYDSTGQTFNTYCWQVDAGLVPNDGNAYWALGAAVNITQQPFLIRDPNGAVRLFCGSQQNTVTTALFQPNGANADPGLNAPHWMDLTDYHNDNPTANNGTYPCYMGPAAAFVTLPMTTGKSPCPLPEPVTPPASKVYKDCWLQRQVLILFSNQQTGSSIYYATRYYGTLIGVPNYTTVTPDATRQQQMLLSMVADTFPYPPPAPSVWDNSSPSGMVDWTACTYTYMVGDETETDVSVESGFAAGLKFGADCTEGIGLKEDVSFASGTDTLFGQTSTTTRVNGLEILTKGIPNPNATEDNGDTFLIAPQGTLFGRSYPNLTQDVFVFADDTNTLQFNTAVPAAARLRVDGAAPPVAVGGQFNTYCYTPGMLQSYSEATINITMRNAFNALSQSAKEDFVIDGRDYSVLYTGGSYVADVVKLFGARSFGPTGDLSYLEFSFSETGNQKTEFQATSSFTAAGTSYTDLSDYIGAGGGAGIDIFGIGETQSFYGEAGVEMNYALTSGAEGSSTWGLQLSGYLNPLASGESYSVWMYFLRPSKLWAAEAKNFGAGNQTSIDFGHSAPVRIMFTVPYLSPALATRLEQSQEISISIE